MVGEKMRDSTRRRPGRFGSDGGGVTAMGPAGDGVSELAAAPNDSGAGRLRGDSSPDVLGPPRWETAVKATSTVSCLGGAVPSLTGAADAPGAVARAMPSADLPPGDPGRIFFAEGSARGDDLMGGLAGDG